MKVYLKKCFLSSALVVASTLVSACSFYPCDNEFRINNFDINFLNIKELNAFGLQSDYLNGNYADENYDWRQNIDQWFKYCNSTQIKKEDIYNALYKKTDFSIDNNPFIKYIYKHKKEAYTYLNNLLSLDAKKTLSKAEKIKFHSIWDEFAGGDYYFYFSEEGPESQEFSFPAIQKNIDHCKDAFIQQRWAYQGIVRAFYSGNKKLVTDLFNKHFSRKNKSWIDNSAQHYLALVSDNKDELMLDCIIHGYDKLTRNIELITYSKSFNDSFAATLDDTTKSYYYFVKGLREFGRGLPYLEKIKSLHPKNKYFDFLLNREINKIEDWLLKPAIVSSTGYYYGYQEECEKKALKDNWERDKAYAGDFLSFLLSINKKTLYHEMLIAYLEHLMGIKTHRFNPEKYKNVKNQYVQARIIDFMINFEKKSATGTYQKDLLFIFNNADAIKRNDPYYNDYDHVPDLKNAHMRQQLARNLGYFMTKFKKHRAEGFLLSGKSNLPQNEGYPFCGQSIYINLYEKADISDCFKIIEILKDKSNNAYLQFLQEDNIHHEKIHYCNEGYSSSKEGEYDTLKIYDIVAQKYVNQLQFQKAVEIYEKFPAEYWNYSCEESPFVVNTHNPKRPYLTAKMNYFNKLTFLQQLVQHQKDLQKNPNNILLNFYVANAFYSLSENGCFWYASCPYHYSQENYNINNSFFLKKSAAHFNKILRLSKNLGMRYMSYVALSMMDEVHLKSQKDKNNLREEFTYTYCDTYAQYLDQISNAYKPAAHVKALRIPLYHFRNF
ncbi:MAG: hypothetical protein ACKOXB_02690 [Flavobacteriales bacterium]